MADLSFNVGRSRTGCAIQILALMLVLTALYQVLSPGIWLVGVCVAVYSLIRLNGNQKPFVLSRLDHQLWSVTEQGKSSQLEIEKILDFQLLVIICFHQKEDQNRIIWRDQLGHKQWKSIKTLAEML